MTTGEWLEGHIRAAPEALRDRILALATPEKSGTDTAQALARIANQTLSAVIRGAGDRGAALDLLAADALITLALLAQAESEPAELGQLSVQLLASGAGAP
ncbi:MAG: hypothetical protein ABI765_09100 [Gemmatimonadota bacterium]